jgi:hypothetical protein
MAFFIRVMVLAFVIGCAPALADDEWPPSAAPADALPKNPGKTYLDLVRLIVPDMDEENGAYKGTATIPMRHIGGDDAEPPEVTSLRRVDILAVNSDGKPRLALFFTLGETPGAVESFTVLALYDLSGEPKLLDAAAVGFDRFTSLYGQQKMPVSAGSDVILTMSEHFNSSQGYVTTAMILVRGDRFELVDTIFTLDEKGCSYERAQAASYEATPGAALFADIKVSVADRITLTEHDCGEETKPEPMSRMVTAIYRWDASQQKYVPDGDALEKLQEENGERL